MTALIEIMVTDSGYKICRLDTCVRVVSVKTQKVTGLEIVSKYLVIGCRGERFDTLEEAIKRVDELKG